MEFETQSNLFKSNLSLFVPKVMYKRGTCETNKINNKLLKRTIKQKSKTKVKGY